MIINRDSPSIFTTRYQSPQLLNTMRSRSNCRGIVLPSLPSLKSSRNKLPSTKTYEKLLKEKIRYSSKIRVLKSKLQQVEKIKKTYGVLIPSNLEYTPKNLKKLEDEAKKTRNLNLSKRAVFQIETWWKKLIIKRKLQDFYNLQIKSAVLIQKNWRKYIERKRFLLIIKKLNTSAVIVQKWVRGYLVRNKYSLVLKKVKMFKIFEYFEEQKKALVEESSRKISDFLGGLKNRLSLKQESLTVYQRKFLKRRTMQDKRDLILPSPEPTSHENSPPERVKRSPTIKATVKSPSSLPKQVRSNHDLMSSLEPIKEVKRVKAAKD